MQDEIVHDMRRLAVARYEAEPCVQYILMSNPARDILIPPYRLLVLPLDCLQELVSSLAIVVSGL